MAPITGVSALLECPTSNGLQYTAGNSIFDIKCGVDYWGGDLPGVERYETFEECITSCSHRDGCVSVAYGDKNCYLKGSVSSDVRDNYNTWTAVLNTTPLLTCVNDASDGKVYTAPSGAQFTIACGTDYYGGDMGLVQTETFTQCLDACASATGCVDVAYNGNFCYLKNKINEARSDSNVWGAKLVNAPIGPASDLTCENGHSDGKTFTAPSGTQFTIECGVDYYGGDLSSQYAETFDDCVKTCDSTSGCIDVAYSNKFCYLKNFVTAPRSDANVWSAKAVNAKSATDGLTCQDNKSNGQRYTSHAGTDYQIVCGTDYFGGDISNLYAETMEICLDTCATTDGCEYVAYSGKYCYLKNSAEGAQSNSNVWGAKSVLPLRR